MINVVIVFKMQYYRRNLTCFIYVRLTNMHYVYNYVKTVQSKGMAILYAVHKS